MADLLPPNATPVERRLAKAGARISDVPVRLADLMIPEAIPASLLPWLAGHLGVES
jgi:phage tail P2-like protein